jgi:hypothetical protein
MALAGVVVEECDHVSPEDDVLCHHRSIKDKIHFVLTSRGSKAPDGSTANQKSAITLSLSEQYWVMLEGKN